MSATCGWARGRPLEGVMSFAPKALFGQEIDTFRVARPRETVGVRGVALHFPCWVVTVPALAAPAGARTPTTATTATTNARVRLLNFIASLFLDSGTIDIEGCPNTHFRSIFRFIQSRTLRQDTLRSPGHGCVAPRQPERPRAGIGRRLAEIRSGFPLKRVVARRSHA